MGGKEVEVCGAQLRKKSGRFCQRKRLKGKKRCGLHGGQSLAGIASKRYKHGRYSRYLPTDLRKQYEESKHDTQLLSHEPDLRLMDLHLQTLVKQLDSTQSLEAFALAKEQWELFETAQEKGDTDESEKIKLKLRDLMHVDIPAGSLWGEIREVVEQRRKLLESESRRIQNSQNSMSGEQILALIEYIVDVLRSSVSKYADRYIATKILQQVTNDIGLIVSKPNDAPPSIARLVA